MTMRSSAASLAVGMVVGAALSAAWTSSQRCSADAEEETDTEKEPTIGGPSHQVDRAYSIKVTRQPKPVGLGNMPSPGFAGMVTELDLGGCGLTELPAEVGLMTGLRRLNAAKNDLSTLPVSFANLQSLRVLFFLGCRFEEVPSCLGGLVNLFMLSFKANRVRTVPEDALSPSIEWLILSDNQITHLPQSIGRLTHLRKLMLAGNQLTELPSELCTGCRELELVRLADNRLAAMPCGLLELPRLAWIALASNAFNSQLSTDATGRIQAAPGVVTLDEGEPLGQGASGVVRGGFMRSAQAATADPEVQVAVKLFRAGRTSDGRPSDEMVATAAAADTAHPALMRCFGRADICTQQGEQAALVFERLDGWSALAGPPSFDSVTRDVYPDDVGARFSAEEARAVARAIAGAAAALHSVRLSHGDLYGHNTLIPPVTANHNSARDGFRPSSPTQDATPSGGSSGSGSIFGNVFRSSPSKQPASSASDKQQPTRPAAILSDFGAAFFYEDGPTAALVERVEVLAFGHLLDELVNATDLDAPDIDALIADCRSPVVASRPSFAQVLERLDT